MSILDEREDYLKNPFFVKHEYGDFTSFYVTVTVCSLLFALLCVLNIAFCWCSRHREYWQSPHTGVFPSNSILNHTDPLNWNLHDSY